MKPEDFIKEYEVALGTQDWGKVSPLIHEDASVTFSNGLVHIGKEKVQSAFEKNFSAIKSESYAVSNVHWLRKEETFAVYLFQYDWSGIINGNLIKGNGLGTSVLVKENSCWYLLTEHLGKKA